MAIGKLVRIMSAGASAAGIAAYFRYRKDIKSIRAAIDSGSTIAETAAGPIEYAEAGEGEPMLVIHGAGGGYDQGLLIGSDMGEGHRIIAPSRFGYLKAPVPEDPSPAAQAEAHAALLDFLGITRTVVVGVSAGAPSAIELALRHPRRVSALILLVPRTYDPTGSIGVDASAQSQAVLRLIETSADFLFWAAMRLARSSVVRFLGVPSEVEKAASEPDRQRVTQVMRSILPLSSRVRGIAADSSVEISPWPLEQISTPTLVVSAEDDLFRTLPGARFTAEHIKGADMHVLKSGGHLMVGQTATIRSLVQDFLTRHRRKERRRLSSEQAAAGQELEAADA
jgi:pimeloyl-ACP methyl ester carboxylesterase